MVFDEELLDEPARRKSPEEIARERPFLVHRVDLIGERENAAGKKCQAGYIILTNAGGGTLSGMAVSTDDCLEVDPVRFRGNKIQLSYWVDTDELPDTHEVFIQLKTGHEQRDISVFEMINQQKVQPVSKLMGTMKLLAPAAGSLALFYAAFFGLSFYIIQLMEREVGKSFYTMQLMRDAPQSLSKVVIWTHLLGYFFLWTGGFVPVWVGKVFKKFPPSTQELLQARRRMFMLLPSAFAGIGVVTPLLTNKLTGDSDFPSLNLYGMYLIFLGLNFASTYYQELYLTEQFEDWIHDHEARKVLHAFAWGVFVTIILMGVAG